MDKTKTLIISAYVCCIVLYDRCQSQSIYFLFIHSNKYDRKMLIENFLFHRLQFCFYYYDL